MAQCIALVNAAKGSVAVIELMNNPDRCFILNFQNLWYGRPLTIEFRQGPGVTSSTDVLAWAEYAVTFVGAAIRPAGSYRDLQTYAINVGGLKRFLPTPYLDSRQIRRGRDWKSSPLGFRSQSQNRIRKWMRPS